MNDDRDDAADAPVRPDDDKATGVKLVVLVFGLPLLLVLLSQLFLF